MTLDSLHCVAGQARRPDAAETEALFASLPEWRLEDDALTRDFRFADYHETIAFVNALAWIAHREDHHPDLCVHYNRVRVQWRTHAAGGITLNDFICAAKSQALMTRHP